MIFDSWAGLGRILAVGVLSYLSHVVLLRISGNRTLSKLNAFDLIITVALGSTLASIVLDKTVALAEGVLALALLIGLQFLVTLASVHSAGFSKTVKSSPVLLVHRGALLVDAMRRARIVEDEILAALRSNGVRALSDVQSVVLETDGSLSVLRTAAAAAEPGTLQNVERPRPSPPRSLHAPTT